MPVIEKGVPAGRTLSSGLSLILTGVKMMGLANTSSLSISLLEEIQRRGDVVRRDDSSKSCMIYMIYRER
jgi:hypothetical protein